MLKIKSISCQKGYNQLFVNLSFYLKSGDIGRIIGSNGCGKTSLLKILAGISKADDGTILLDDKNINSEYYKKNTLYLGHQSLVNPYLSVVENLDFLAKLNNYTVDYTQALDKIKLLNYANEYCYKLSVGQKRRVILAMLFISKQKLWLLDEPFTSIDVDGVSLIEEVITKHLSNGGICIFTTHQNTTLNCKELSL